MQSCAFPVWRCEARCVKARNRSQQQQQDIKNELLTRFITNYRPPIAGKQIWLKQWLPHILSRPEQCGMLIMSGTNREYINIMTSGWIELNERNSKVIKFDNITICFYLVLVSRYFWRSPCFFFIVMPFPARKVWTGWSSIGHFYLTY